MITNDRVFLHPDPQKAPAEAASPAVTSVLCRRCDSLGQHQVVPGSGPHWRGVVCADCGAFITWLKKPRDPEAWRARMASFPPTNKQLTFLQRLGFTGPQPTTKLAASEAITALLQRPGGVR